MQSMKSCFKIPVLLHDLSVCSGAGDQNEEELSVPLRHVVTVHRLACSLADGRAMHDGTAHQVLTLLAPCHRLQHTHSHT